MNYSVILANLTPAEYDSFYAAGITFSGSTGKGARPESYGGVAPYIATYFSELPKALAALGWKRAEIKFSGEQLQVNRVKDHKRTIITIQCEEE